MRAGERTGWTVPRGNHVIGAIFTNNSGIIGQPVDLLARRALLKLRHECVESIDGRHPVTVNPIRIDGQSASQVRSAPLRR